MDSQSWFLIGRCGISFVFLGRRNQPMDSQSWFKAGFCNIGRCGISFVFFRASVRNVRHSGRCAGQGMLGT